MLSVSDIKEALLHLFYPHTCDGCGSSILNKDSCLCLRCIHSIPLSFFDALPNNPVERKFYGRINVRAAMSFAYFGKNSLMAHLVHEVKYKKNKELGLQLGRMMGQSICKSGRFPVDLLVPLPLFPDRQRKRGYNQSTLLCQGIKEYLNVPILDKIVQRPLQTETQTKKGRIERWKNMEGKFILKDKTSIQGKHILLIDDVITTGATLESCGATLLQAKDSIISIACLCHAFS